MLFGYVSREALLGNGTSNETILSGQCFSRWPLRGLPQFSNHPRFMRGGEKKILRLRSIMGNIVRLFCLYLS